MTEGNASAAPSLNDIFAALRWVVVTQDHSDASLVGELLEPSDGIPVDQWSLDDPGLLGTLANRSPREPILLLLSSTRAWGLLFEALTTLAFHHGPIVLVPPADVGAGASCGDGRAVRKLARVRVRCGDESREVWIIRHARTEIGAVVWGPDPRYRSGRPAVPAHLSAPVPRPLDDAGLQAAIGTLPGDVRPRGDGKGLIVDVRATTTVPMEVAARGALTRGLWPVTGGGGALAPELGSVAHPAPGAGAGSTEFDRRLVEERRKVLLQDAWVRAELDRLAVSLVLVTRRPDFLPRAVEQFRHQRGIATELIVVGHGFDPERVLPSRVGGHSWDRASSVPSSATLGDGLNHGCDLASAPLILKVDDDDWYGEYMAVDLAMELIISGAELVGKAMEFIYLGSLDVTVRRAARSERYGEHVSGATMLIRRTDLRELGGWASVPRAVDSRLLDSVRRAGATYFAMNGFGYMVNRHGTDNTFKVPDAWFLDNSAEQWLGCATAAAGIALANDKARRDG